MQHILYCLQFYVEKCSVFCMDGCDCFEFTFESSVTISVFCDGTILRMVGGDLVLVYTFTICIIMPSYLLSILW